MARPKEFDRQRVLNKAMQVFWQNGYEATSMQALVEGMGINRQSIYDTFGDKQALFIEAVRYYEEVEGTKVLNALTQPGSAKAAIRQAFDIVLEKPLEEQQRGCFMVNTTVEFSSRSCAITELVRKTLTDSEELFYQILVRAQEQGEIGTGRNLQALARFLVSSFRGLRVTSKAITDKQVLQDIVTVTLSVLD